MMREPATVDERAPLLRGAGSGFNRRGASIRGCLDDVSRVASNRWFRAAMVAKSAFFTLGTVILLHHGTSMSTGRTRREGNGYLEVPAEAHFAPLWSGDHLRHHPAADDLNVAWFPVHRGRFVMDQAAERAKDAARGGNRAKDDRMPKWPKHVIGGDDWADLGVVAMSGAFGGAREKQPEFWFHAVPGDVPVVSMDVRGHGESERGWNALSVDDAFDAVRWNLMANDVLAVADDAKFRRVVLVGSSMTNAVALWAAVSPHVKDRVAGVLLVRPATGWEIRGEGICKLRKIAWTHASFAMLLRRSRRFAEGVDSDELDSDDLPPLPPPELTSSLVGKSERVREGDANAKGGSDSGGSKGGARSDSESGWVSRWVLKGSAWKRYRGNPGLGKPSTKVEPRDEVYKSIKELDPGLDGYWSKMVEKYLGTSTDGANYLAAAKRYAESEPEEWRRISPLVPLRYLGDKVSDYPSRRALQLWFASPAGNKTPVKVIAYNWSRTHRYVMAKALRFLTGGDWSRDYLADGHDGLARDIAEFVEKVRRREESIAGGGDGGDGGKESDEFWREDEEDEERIAGVTRDEDWVRSDYVDSLDYDDGNADDVRDDDDDEASSALGRRRRRRTTRAMHGLMKEIDALLGAEDAEDMEAEIDSVPGHVLEAEATRLVRADAERVTARGRSLDDWLVENFGPDKSLASLDLLDYCDGRCCRLKTQLPESGWVPEKARSGPGIQWVFHEELASEEAKCYAREAEDAAREERRVRAGGRLTREERVDVEAEQFCVAVIKARAEETKSAAEESRATLAASVGDVEKS